MSFTITPAAVENIRNAWRGNVKTNGKRSLYLLAKDHGLSINDVYSVLSMTEAEAMALATNNKPIRSFNRQYVR